MKMMMLALSFLAGCAATAQNDSSAYNSGAAMAANCELSATLSDEIVCMQDAMVSINGAAPESRLFFLRETNALLDALRRSEISDEEARIKYSRIKRQTIVYVQAGY